LEADLAESFDVIIRGGRVIDPKNDLDDRLDVGLRAGKVAAVGDLSEDSGADEIDATGKLVTPGLIDLHTHLFKDFSIFGIDVDELSPRTGVTTSVDTGTAGWINYAGFRKVIMEPAETRVLAFVNLSGVGLPYRQGEMVYEGYVQASECANSIQQFPENTVGVKVRLYRGVGGDADLRDLLQIALEAARRCEKPLMIHISGGDVPLAELLEPLRQGDVITHCYHGGEISSILDGNGKVQPQVRDAREKGIIFDIGHGVGSFSFDVGRKAMDDGFPPDTISSDIHAIGINGPTFDLPTTMTKFQHLGMPIGDIIARTTTAPAAAVDWDLGHLSVGAIGDVAVLEEEEGSFELTDAEKVTLVSEKRLVCSATMKDGKVWWKAS
jgi:dihydroorotase